ncbi:hypothetical protein [Streptomyces sp. NPDC056390]
MKIATAQFTCVPADVSANVRQMAALIDEARVQGPSWWCSLSSR